MLIKLLEDRLLIDINGDCWGKGLPETKEIIDKINEIINYINEQEQNKR